MYIAKYGLISMSGNVAKLAASHDFRSYVNNMAFMQATQKTKHEIQDGNGGKSSQSNARGSRPKKECRAI